MSNLAGAMQASMGLESMVNGFVQAGSTRLQGKYQAQQLNTEAQIADLAAQEAGIQGGLATQREGFSASQKMGQLVAAYAGQGVSVNSGSALASAEGLRYASGLNEQAIKTRVWQEQLGYRFKSLDDRSQANMALLASENMASAKQFAGIATGLSYGLQAGESLYEGAKANTPSSDIGYNPSGSLPTPTYSF